MEHEPGSFAFHSKGDLTFLLGTSARNVSELLAGVKFVPPSSIYYHTHKYLQQHHYLSPEPPNDFGFWATSVLNEELLGERLYSIDVVRFHSIQSLREAVISVLEEYLASSTRDVQAPPGEEFHFMGTQTFVYQTAFVAGNLQEFKRALQMVSVHSLYYHVFDACLRLNQEENDFSAWFRRLGYRDLADEMKKLDPYTQTLEGLRKTITTLIERHGEA